MKNVWSKHMSLGFEREDKKCFEKFSLVFIHIVLKYFNGRALKPADAVNGFWPAINLWLFQELSSWKINLVNPNNW